MTIITAIILGLLQAAGEFLPISSSAHLALYSFFAGAPYQGLNFDIMLHLATLIAVVSYFWKDLFKLTIAGLSAPKSVDGLLFWYIGLATVPAALAGYFLQDAAEHSLRSPLIIAFMLAFFAALLMWADRFAAKRAVASVLNPGLMAMLLIGYAQALALMPGVSRSGITITAALLLGLGREKGARISFLLSVPIIAGAAMLKLKHLSLAEIDAPFIAGFLAASIGGWLVIKFLMKYIQNHTFDIFVYYRWLLAAVIVIAYFIKG